MTWALYTYAVLATVVLSALARLATRLSASTLHRLLQRFRTGGTVEFIVARPRGWRAGANRLAGEAERVISEAINGFYLAQPAPSVSEVYRDVTNWCASAGAPVDELEVVNSANVGVIEQW